VHLWLEFCKHRHKELLDLRSHVGLTGCPVVLELGKFGQMQGKWHTEVGDPRSVGLVGAMEGSPVAAATDFFRNADVMYLCQGQTMNYGVVNSRRRALRK
jgi:hypothetical protein